MKKSYIITKDVKSPVVVSSNVAHKPAQVRFKTFRRGQIVQGELKHSDNRPAFVLVGRMCVIPIDCIKELQGKEITSNFSDQDSQTQQAAQKKTIQVENPKIKYMDALLIGGVVGYAAVHVAIEKGYIQTEDPKAKIYGALGGAVLGMYLVYRNVSSQKPKTTPKQ